MSSVIVNSCEEPEETRPVWLDDFIKGANAFQCALNNSTF